MRIPEDLQAVIAVEGAKAASVPEIAHLTPLSRDEVRAQEAEKHEEDELEHGASPGRLWMVAYRSRSLMGSGLRDRWLVLVFEMVCKLEEQNFVGRERLCAVCPV